MRQKTFNSVVKRTYLKSKKYLPKDTGSFRENDYDLEFKRKNALISFNESWRKATKRGKNAGRLVNIMEILDKGTKPHNIPNAFNNAVNRGVPIGSSKDYGMSGNYNGMFHSGSKKHKGLFDNFFQSFLMEMINDITKRGIIITNVKRGRP